MLTVRDIMLTQPQTITPSARVESAIDLMRQHGIMQLPVVVNTDFLVGIITDRDTRLVMNLPILADMIVEDCMTADPMTVSAEMPAYRAANILTMYKFGALPVVEEGRLVGLVTSTQFLQYFTRDQSGS